MKIVFALLAAGAHSLASYETSFEAYVAHFEKPYAKGSATWAARERVFVDAMARIEAHNARHAAGLESYDMGANAHTDLTPAEFNGLKGYVAGARAAPTPVAAGAAPSTIDWRAKGAVTPVKNQGSCGSCWSFSATGAMEGAYFLATGALRSLSEQELVDCSTKNSGCKGGSMQEAFAYAIANKGMDSEKDYPYAGMQFKCWTNATKRVVASIASYASVPPNDEAALEAAVALGPVSVAIEADQSGFQNYKSGVFDGPCGTKLDHGVLVVGYSADAWIVKNSWGASWGDTGYIQLKRGVNATGLCGITMDASRPVAATASPVPIPPPTPGKPPSDNLPCNCTASCESTCQQFGLVCCGDGNNCNCSNLSSCPKCDPTKHDDAASREAPAWLAATDCVDVEGACSIIDGTSTCCPGLTCYEETACIKLD